MGGGERGDSLIECLVVTNTCELHERIIDSLEIVGNWEPVRDNLSVSLLFRKVGGQQFLIQESFIRKTCMPP